MTNLDSIFKSRDITLPTKVCLVEAMVFPVVMYRCESWTVKKAEHQRVDAFELWCWRRLLRVPWIARRSNQSILKEISLECSLEGLMLRLKLQNFGHLTQRAIRVFFIWKDPDAGKDWRQEKGTTEDEMAGWHHWLNGHEFGWTLGIGDGQGGLACCGPRGRKESDITERLNWTDSYFTMLCLFLLYSRLNQFYVCIHPLFFRFPSHSGHHRALSKVPCAIWWVLISYLFCTWYQQCIYVNPNLPIYSPHHFPYWYP